MKRARFSEEQIIGVPKEAAAGAKVSELEPANSMIWRRKGPGGPTGLQNRLGGQYACRKVRLLPPSARIAQADRKNCRWVGNSLSSPRESDPVGL